MTSPSKPARKSTARATSKKAATKAASRATSSGPSHPEPSDGGDRLERKAADTQATVASMPVAEHLLAEADPRYGYEPAQGAHVPVPPDVAASTVSESNVSRKTGEPAATDGDNGNDGSLDACASTPAARSLTTNQGVRGRRQPELAEGRACAARRCSKTSSCARRSRTSTTSASPSASCTRAARRAHGYFECLRRR